MAHSLLYLKPSSSFKFAFMKKYLLAIICLCLFANVQAQQKLAVYAGGFYNLENLFDTEDDPENPGDDEFLPDGPYHWTEEKYKKKLSNMANTIFQLGRNICPAGVSFLAVSEVENRRVLEDLVATEPLAAMNYQIVHYPSPDRRGIDVAFLYNPKLFQVLSSRVYPYVYPENPDYRSRDQLLVSGLMAGEKVHIIVNHWPSRYGGDKSSVYREAAAAICKHITDSILTADPMSKIIITGDLNDDPDDVSCKDVLKAKKSPKKVKPNELFNTTWPLFAKGVGTLCYQGQWNLYDQIIISGNWLGTDRSTLKYWKNEIFNRSFLLQAEGKRKGYPFRTFSGKKFQGGYSDHLPSLIYFVKKLP